MNPVFIASSSIVLYLASAVLLALGLRRGHATLSHNKGLLLVPAVLAALLHAALLAQTLPTTKGLNLVFFNALSLSLWLIVLLMLLVATYRPVQSLGIALLPLSAVAVLLSIVFGKSIPPGDAVSSEILLHIVISILAYSLLAFAALLALLLAAQINSLHAHRPRGIIRTLPPLNAMEALLFKVIGVGFFLLTGSLLTGFVYLENMFAQHLVHKTVLSLVAWLVFGTLLAGRKLFGWRGKTAVRWTLGGIGLLMLAYFGSKLVLELILQR
jgi:ABC-type uncharacterized transport system permease subunit